MQAVETSRVFSVEGPIKPEIFVVWMNQRGIELTGPCGAAPWHLEARTNQHPMEVVKRMVARTIGEPLLVHSTSWRHEDDAVILTFLAMIDPALVGDMASLRIQRVELARSEASAPPQNIEAEQVLEHAIRHLAWLAQDDDPVKSQLTMAWQDALRAYVPEPFRYLG